MTNETLLALLIFVPLIGAFALPLIARLSEAARNIAALCMVLCSLACAAALLPAAIAGQEVSIRLASGLGGTLFVLDRLAVFMALVSSGVGAVIVFYSFSYIAHYEHRNEYYSMVVLFLGSMMGIVFAGNLIFLYLFWEITGFTSWRLIGYFREPKIVLKADKAFLVTVFGALLMLAGFILVYQETGSFDMLAIKAFLAGRPISNAAVLLILCGILSKSATLPFQTWLPDAGVAPSPVTALLHAAVLVKIGVYVFARLFVATMGVEAVWHTVVPIIAAASALVSAGAAMIETDMKRIIAYSTISQIGFIFLGLSSGVEVGIAGGLLYILMHGISKGGLFLCAGIIEHQTHTKDITKMGGLASKMPLTAFAFLFCSFSVMGVPPFGGFFSKYLVFSGAFSSGQTAIGLVFLLGAFMTIIYLFRLFSSLFLGEMKIKVAGEGSPGMVGSVVLLAVLSLASGLAVSWPSTFLRTAVLAMLGGSR